MKRLDPPDAGSGSAGLPPVAPASARDDDSEPRGYFVGACGHRVPLVGPICYVGPCEECGVGR